MPKNVISFFAGVGGIDIGFEKAGDFKTVYANEFDKKAQYTFSANFGDNILDRRDIRDVNPREGLLGEINADVLLAGFPCQPFSIAGYRRGLEDERGDLFFETLRIIQEKQPQVVFLENVKNLVTHDKGNTFKVIREFLVHSGYFIKWKVLNAKDYGNIPQNRERIYVVGFKDKNAYDEFVFPDEIKLTTKLSDIINFDKVVDSKYYYEKGKQSFYDELVDNITSSDTIYQWRRQYVRENKSGVVPTLTANMGTGGHNVPLIRTTDGRIRKLTPRETFNAQGYSDNYILPIDEADSSLYKQSGNSVVIPVIERIAKNIEHALNFSKSNDPLPHTKDKFAVVYSEMNGRMEGQSHLYSVHNTYDEAKRKIDDNGLVYYDDNKFFDAIKHGGKHKFYSIIG